MNIPVPYTKQTPQLRAWPQVFRLIRRFKRTKAGPLGDEVSFFKLEPASLALSALKQSESGKSVIMRFFNPIKKKVQAKVSCFADITSVWQTNLNEQRLRKLTSESNRAVSINVRSKEIVTLEMMTNFKT